MKYFSATFQGSAKEYTFKRLDHLPLEPGNLVLVDTSNGMNVVRVVQDDIPEPSFKCQPLLIRVDLIADMMRESYRAEKA